MAYKGEFKVEEDVLEISLNKIFQILWRKAGIIVLCLVVGAGIGFLVSDFLIDPTYTSKVSMYVNNNKDRANAELNINDINASQKLVATYIEILNSDVVLNQVIKKLGLEYTTEKIRKCISASAVNGTEILEVKVTTKDPQEAADIANTLAEVGQPEIIRVVQAGGVEMIDQAVANEKAVAPNILLNTIIGALVGCIAAIMAVLIFNALDISVKVADELEKHFKIPVIGAIPDLVEAMKNN